MLAHRGHVVYTDKISIVGHLQHLDCLFEIVEIQPTIGNDVCLARQAVVIVSRLGAQLKPSGTRGKSSNALASRTARPRMDRAPAMAYEGLRVPCSANKSDP